MWTEKIDFNGSVPILASITEEFFDGSLFECHREQVAFSQHRMSFFLFRGFSSLGVNYEHKFRVTGIEKFGGGAICTLRLESEQQRLFYGEMFNSYELHLSSWGKSQPEEQISLDDLSLQYIKFFSQCEFKYRKLPNLLHRILTVKYEHLDDDRRALITWGGKPLRIEEWIDIVSRGLKDDVLLDLYQFGQYALEDLKAAIKNSRQ